MREWLFGLIVVIVAAAAVILPVLDAAISWYNTITQSLGAL